ncbi:MAG: radical SAM protein [Spirochaetales bacterium]|nr:radical SAM protein [Spirochaetales bacterium]
MKQICIAAPPLNDFYFSPLRNSAIGLFTLKSALEARSYPVTMFNFPADGKKRQTITLPRTLGYLKKNLNPAEKGPVSFFSSYYRFGPDIAACADQIIGSKPDLVLIGLFAFAYADSCLDLIAELKKRNNCPVLLGGAGVTVHPSFFLNYSCADFLFIGEADQVISDCIDFILEKGNRPCPAGLLDTHKKYSILTSSPVHPDYFSVTPSIVWENKQNIKISVMLSRGCPFNCTFCVNSIVFGKTIRTGQTDFLFDLVRKYRNKRITLNIEDDNIAANNSFLESVIAKIRSIAGNVDLIFENGLDYRLIDPDLLVYLIENGLVQANFSLATLDSHKSIRPSNTERLEILLDICRRKRIPSIVYFIAGLQTDTMDSIVSTVDYVFSLPARIGFSPFYAVPGMNDFPVGDDIRPDDIPLYRGSSMYPWYDSLSTDDLICIFRFVRVLNYCREHTMSASRFIGDGFFTVKTGERSLIVPAPSPMLFDSLKSSLARFFR